MSESPQTQDPAATASPTGADSAAGSAGGASIVTRTIAGAVAGLAIGIIGVLVINIGGFNVSLNMQVGVLLWYAMVGYFIGIMGVLVRWPWLINIRLPWWLRGASIGADMNLVLVLFAYGSMEPHVREFCPAMAGFWTMLLLAIVEGAIIGALLDYIATRYGGEGAATLTPDTQS